MEESAQDTEVDFVRVSLKETLVGDSFPKDNIGLTALEEQACNEGSILQTDCHGQGENKRCIDFDNVNNNSLEIADDLYSKLDGDISSAPNGEESSGEGGILQISCHVHEENKSCVNVENINNNSHADGYSKLEGDISSATNEDKDSNECDSFRIDCNNEEENNTSVDRQNEKNCMASIPDLAKVATSKEQCRVSAKIEFNYSQLQKVDFERGTLVNTRKGIWESAVHKVENNCFSQAENSEDALKSMSSVETVLDSEHTKLDGKVYSMNSADKEFHSISILPQDNPEDVAQPGTWVETIVGNKEGKLYEVYSMGNIDQQLNNMNIVPQGRAEDFETSSSSDSSSETESSSSESSESSSEDDLEDIRNEIKKDEEQLVTGPPRTKGELSMKDLPEVPALDITLDSNAELVELGEVFAVVECLVVIKALPKTPALDADSVLFLENRSCLGLVFETFGPVQTPYYSVRFNKEGDITQKNIHPGDKVFFVADMMEYSHFVFVKQLKTIRGSDASWKNDEEPPPEFVEYSDDEEESKAKSSLKKERVVKKSTGVDQERGDPTKSSGTGQLNQGHNRGGQKRSWQGLGRGKKQAVQYENRGSPDQNSSQSLQHTPFRGPASPMQGPDIRIGTPQGGPSLNLSYTPLHPAFRGPPPPFQGPGLGMGRPMRPCYPMDQLNLEPSFRFPPPVGFPRGPPVRGPAFMVPLPRPPPCTAPNNPAHSSLSQPGPRVGVSRLPFGTPFMDGGSYQLQQLPPDPSLRHEAWPGMNAAHSPFPVDTVGMMHQHPRVFPPPPPPPSN